MQRYNGGFYDLRGLPRLLSERGRTISPGAYVLLRDDIPCHHASAWCV